MTDKNQGNQLFNNTLLSSGLNLEDFTTASLVPVNLDDEPEPSSADPVQESSNELYFSTHGSSLSCENPTFCQLTCVL